jgi:hypothetical protein
MIFKCTALGNWGLPERITRPSMALATTMFWALTAVGFTFRILFLLTWAARPWGASSPSRAWLREVLAAAFALWPTAPQTRSSTTCPSLLPASAF